VVVITYSWDQLVAWLGVVVPLFGISWAAIQHVRTEKRDQKFQEYRKFFEIMINFGFKDSTVPGNMAAVFELRKFSQYKEVIIRLCENSLFEGNPTQLLAREMALTADALRATK
jgi:hypothetical protein